MLTILFYHASSYFLITNLELLIPAVIAQIVNSIAVLVIPIRMPTKEGKVEVKTHPVIVEMTISK